MAGASQFGPRKLGLPPAFRAFQDRNYRLLWPGNLLVYTCRWMQLMLIAWLVLERTNSPSLVALVGFFAWAPMLLLGLIGGVLADTRGRQKVMAFTAGSNFVAALVFTALLISGLDAVWHAYLIVSVSGAAWALDMPSRRSVILDMLGRSGVTNGLALDSMGMSLAMMLGPVLAGVLIDLLDVKGGYAVVSAFYLASTVLLASLRVRQADRLDRARRSIIGSLVDGLKYVISHRALRAILMITVLMNLLLFSYMPMVPVMARDVLGAGPVLIGLLSAAAGAGSLLGALALASAGEIRHHGRLLMMGSTVAMLSLLFFSLSRWYVPSFSALVLLGIGVSAFGPVQFTLFMLLAREDMRGKALGVISLAIGTSPLGALLLGAVASLSGPGIALGVNAVAGLVGMALIAAFIPSLRQPTAALRSD